MLVVNPAPDIDENEIKTLNAYLDGEPCGYIRFRLNGYIIVVTELIPLLAESPFSTEKTDDALYGILDTIIRALGSYGLNHSCFYVECGEPALYPTLEKLRFELKDGVMKSNLQKLLTSCSH